MIHMTKLHVGLLIVICTVEFIDASCLSYGHSCWGAHGKRSNVPQRESKPGELNDRWALFKIMPERNEMFQFKKLFRGNSNLQQQFPDSDIGKPLNFPMLDQQLTSLEDPSQEKDVNRNLDNLIQDSDEIQKHPFGIRPPYMDNIKPFQVVRLNKQNFEQ